jgi:hypothetical protein
MADPYPQGPGIAGPADNAQAVSGSDAPLAVVPRGIHCNATGLLSCVMKGGQQVDFILQQGMFYPYRVVKVLPATDASVVLIW